MKFATSSFRDARLRELLLWCAPALLAGALLRLFMEVRMPYGYIQFDSADFLLTPFRLLSDHHYVIDSKKAFLTPTFFTIPFLLHIPALLFIPIVQHLMGPGRSADRRGADPGVASVVALDHCAGNPPDCREPLATLV